MKKIEMYIQFLNKSTGVALRLKKENLDSTYFHLNCRVTKFNSSLSKIDIDSYIQLFSRKIFLCIKNNKKITQCSLTGERLKDIKVLTILSELTKHKILMTRLIIFRTLGHEENCYS